MPFVFHVLYSELLGRQFSPGETGFFNSREIGLVVSIRLFEKLLLLPVIMRRNFLFSLHFKVLFAICNKGKFFSCLCVCVSRVVWHLKSLGVYVCNRMLITSRHVTGCVWIYDNVALI